MTTLNEYIRKFSPSIQEAIKSNKLSIHAIGGHFFLSAVKVLILFFSLGLSAQHVPDKVEKEVLRRAIGHKLGIDTIKFENCVYIVKIDHVGLDTLNFKYDLLSKKKLFTDYWKTAGITYFGVAMAEMLTLPSLLPQDKNLHLAAGTIIGGVTTWCAWRYTKLGSKNDGTLKGIKRAISWKSKLICAGIGIIAGTVAGFSKEYIYDRNFGSVVSFKDAAFTSGGAAFGSIGGVIVIGNKTKKQYILP